MRKILLASIVATSLAGCGSTSELGELLKEAQGNNVVQALIDAGGKVKAVSDDVRDNFAKLIDEKYCKLPAAGRAAFRDWLNSEMKAKVGLVCPGETLTLDAR